MAEVPKNYFQKSFLALGILACIGALYGAKWIHAYYALERRLPSIAASFNSFHIYQDPYYLPAGMKFLDTMGKEVDLEHYRGQYLVLNIWATWCKPCITELPSLQKLQDQLKEDRKWRVMAVSIDMASALDKVAIFTKRTKTEEIANYFDHKTEIQKNIPMRGLPTTYIISASGRVLYEVRGDGMWHLPEIVEFLRLVERVY